MTDGGTTAGDGAVIVTPCTLDNTPPGSAFDCAAIEAQIFAGNIAAVPDAELIAWAQNGCNTGPGDDVVSPSSSVTPMGANNVLLLEAGATRNGFTFNGFARTLLY